MPLNGQAGLEPAAPAGRCRNAAITAVALAAGLCSLSLAAAQPGQPSSVIINEEVRHYTIEAGSIDELRDRLRHDVPGRGGTHGRTWSDVRIAYELDRSGEGCRIRDLEVRLDIEVTLPEWEPGNRVPKAQREHWARALAALERHEATHRANARAAAEEVRDRVQDIGRLPDCKTVRDTANRLLRRTMLKYEFRDRRYDARTRNGAEQGAVL